VASPRVRETRLVGICPAYHSPSAMQAAPSSPRLEHTPTRRGGTRLALLDQPLGQGPRRSGPGRVGQMQLPMAISPSRPPGGLGASAWAISSRHQSAAAAAWRWQFGHDHRRQGRADGPGSRRHRRRFSSPQDIEAVIHARLIPPSA
jgi:hypothetical protein